MTRDTESGIAMIRTDNCIVDITNNEVWYLLALNLIVAIAAAWVARLAYRENAKFTASVPAPENLPPPVRP